MSASVLLASDGSPGKPHQHNGYSQSRTHHRKAAPERIPLQAGNTQSEKHPNSTINKHWNGDPNAPFQRIKGQSRDWREYNGYPPAQHYSSTPEPQTEVGCSDPQTLSEKASSMSTWTLESWSHSNGSSLPYSKGSLGVPEESQQRHQGPV